MKAHDFPHEEHELDSPFLDELQWEDESPFLPTYYEVEPASPFLESEAFEAEQASAYAQEPYGEEEYIWLDYEEEGQEEDLSPDEDEAYLLTRMSEECEQEDCTPELEAEEWEDEQPDNNEYIEEESYYEYAESGEWETGDGYEDQETSDVLTETYDHNEVETRPGNDFTESELEELFISLDKLGGWVKGRLASRVQAFPITDLTVVPREKRERTLEEAMERGYENKKTGKKEPTHTISRSFTSPRDLNLIDAVVLHHMAIYRGNAFNKYYKVVSHYIILQDGKIGKLWGPEFVLNASNGFNKRSIAIEFAGNFPNDKNRWRKGDENGRHCPTDAQIKAGRFLLQHLKQTMPNIRYVFAHRQSSSSRTDDPGPDIWFNVAEFAIKYLGYSEDSRKVKVGNGQVIPESWKNWGSETNRKCSPSTSIPLPAATDAGAEDSAGKQPGALESHLIGLMNKGVFGLSVFTSIMAGERNANRLTDMIFFQRHPERKGRPISGNEQEAIREWKDIHATVVTPLLQMAGGGPTIPTSPTIPTAPTTPSVPSQWAHAIARNRHWGRALGWDKHIYQINNLLLPYSGMENVSLGEEAFAEAVARWQARNGFSGDDVDGIIGPNTWRKMKGQLGLAAPSTNPGSTAVTTGNSTNQTTGLPTSLGILKIDTSQRGLERSFPEYRFTPEDALWLARFVIGEAGGTNDKDNHAVIWAMFNRFGTLRHLVPSWTSFAKFLQLYSTPLQHPYVYNVGVARRIWGNHRSYPDRFPVVSGQETYKGTDVKKVQYRRHIELQQKPWSRIKPEVQDLVLKIMNGQIPNPGIGMATDFASTWVYYVDKHKEEPSIEEWRRYTINYANSKTRPPIAWIGEVDGINQMKNAFFIRKSYVGLPANAVRIIAL